MSNSLEKSIRNRFQTGWKETYPLHRRRLHSIQINEYGGKIINEYGGKIIVDYIAF